MLLRKIIVTTLVSVLSLGFQCPAMKPKEVTASYEVLKDSQYIPLQEKNISMIAYDTQKPWNILVNLSYNFNIKTQERSKQKARYRDNRHKECIERSGDTIQFSKNRNRAFKIEEPCEVKEIVFHPLDENCFFALCVNRLTHNMYIKIGHLQKGFYKNYIDVKAFEANFEYIKYNPYNRPHFLITRNHIIIAIYNKTNEHYDLLCYDNPIKVFNYPHVKKNNF